MLTNFLQSIARRIQVNNWFTRKIWLDVHLFLALGVGLIFAVLGFTGSISIYRDEIDELLNSQLVVEEIHVGRQSLDQMLASVRAVHPDRYGEWTLEMPRSPHSMMTAWFDKPRETYFERYAPLMVSVNPYTAEVVASRFWGQTLTTWLLDLHTQLQLGQTGWEIVGYCALLLIVSVCSGVYLWWPGVSGIKSGIQIKAKFGWMRLLFDLHRMVGLISVPALLVLTITGIHLSFPSVLETLVGSTGMAHGETGKPITSTANPNDRPTVLEAAEFIARGPFPNAELRRITTPDGNSGVYRVNLRQKGEINQRHPYTTVWVDRWSGHIKEVRDPVKFNNGETLMTWLWPLHTGEALGPAGRFCWFMAGQSLLFLYISGIIRWLYHKGKIQDKAVNFTVLKNVPARLNKTGNQLSLVIYQFIIVITQKVFPIMKRLLVNLPKWLGRGLAYCQLIVKK